MTTTQSTISQSKVRRYMKEYVLEWPECGPTELAEQAAWEFEIDQQLDDPDAWIWDVAVQVSEWADKVLKRSTI